MSFDFYIDSNMSTMDISYSETTILVVDVFLYIALVISVVILLYFLLYFYRTWRKKRAHQEMIAMAALVGHLAPAA